LSIFADQSQDEELDTARRQNDQHLKGRFESIFEKYERDFSGVGDEIDLATGEIIVNNGHLAGLEEDAETRSEADESASEISPLPTQQPSSPPNARVRDGKSMLRAMTAAPGSDDTYFQGQAVQGVVQSIESLVYDETIPDSEDVDDISGLDVGEPLGVSSSGVLPDDSHVRDFAIKDHDSEMAISDDDSLFDEEEPHSVESDHDDAARESSPDDLFDVPTAASSATPYDDTRPSTEVFDDLGEVDPMAVVAKFGPDVGQEVLELIKKRDKAELHIEAAWRIPVQMDDRQSTLRTPSKAPMASAKAPRSGSRSSPKMNDLLWHTGRTNRTKLELHQDRAMRVIRAESEDPFQEGFGDTGKIKVVEVDFERAVRLMQRGLCPFCKEEFFHLDKATQHLLEVLPKAGLISTDPRHEHDRVETLLTALGVPVPVNTRPEGLVENEQSQRPEDILLEPVKGAGSGNASSEPMPSEPQNQDATTNSQEKIEAFTGTADHLDPMPASDELKSPIGAHEISPAAPEQKKRGRKKRRRDSASSPVSVKVEANLRSPRNGQTASEPEERASESTGLSLRPRRHLPKVSYVIPPLLGSSPETSPEREERISDPKPMRQRMELKLPSRRPRH
jgi:hypothetical protein